MLEFISFETVKALVLLAFALFVLLASFSVGKKSYSKDEQNLGLAFKRAIPFIVVGLISVPFIEAYNLESDAKKNLNSFTKGKSFICKGKDKNDYIVNQKNGWSKYGIYFIKDSLLIRADKCEEH